MIDDNIINFANPDLEDNFEPLTRTRSNTWPMPEVQCYIDRPLIDGMAMTSSNEFMKINIETPKNHVSQITELSSTKKKSSRRNAWGSLSYAELITLAITSVKDQRLTLSQIYDWLVKNIPFFKDKDDNNSSAGWKNSVRHNLSLHNRFVRVPNEGVGKSSWWMINPNAKSEKFTRRRTTSMEVGKYERKQARARRNVEIIKKENFHTNSIPHLNCISYNHNSIDSYVFNPIPNTRKLKCLSFRSRPFNHTSSNRISPILVHSDSSEGTSKYNFTLEHAPASQFETTHSISMQEAQQTPIQGNMQLDLSSIYYQIDDSTSISRNIQSKPITYTVTRFKEPCTLHHQVSCTCNINVVQLSSTLPTNQMESYIVLEGDKNNQFLLNRYTHQCNINSIQLPLKLTQETNNINLLGLQFDNNLQNKITNVPLIRNNSLLDDIDEIIKREQFFSLDNVNDSIY